MALLTREQILTHKNLKTTIVQVPEWGPDAEVIVREFDGKAKDEWDQYLFSATEKKTKVNIRAKLASLAIVDSNNKLMFSESDIEKLGMTSAKALDRIYEAVSKINQDSAEHIEQLAKN